MSALIFKTWRGAPYVVAGGYIAFRCIDGAKNTYGLALAVLLGLAVFVLWCALAGIWLRDGVSANKSAEPTAASHEDSDDARDNEHWRGKS